MHETSFFPTPEGEMKGPGESLGEPGPLTDEVKTLFASQLRAGNLQAAGKQQTSVPEGCLGILLPSAEGCHSPGCGCHMQGLRKS